MTVRKQDAKQSRISGGLKLEELLRRVEQGDGKALTELKKLLDRTPELWRQIGNLAGKAESDWIALIAGKNQLFAESLKRKLAELKIELTAESPLEKILIERISICWLAANYADASYVQAKDSSFQQARFLLQRQVAMNQRFLASLKALAGIRALLSRVEVNEAKAARAHRKIEPRLKVHKGKASVA